jgi:hypothetical protein
MEREMTEREEREEARRLAEALESGASGDADPRALAVAHLLRGLSGRSAADEETAARALAEALETGVPGGADPRSLSVAHLLASLSPGVAEGDLAARRLRKELVGSASRRTRRVAALRWVAAAALLVAVLGGTRLWRPGRPSDENLLAQREAAAREAIAAIALHGAGELKSARLSAQLDALRAERFASVLRSERIEALVNETEEAGTTEDEGGANRSPAVAHESGGAS